MNVPLTTVVSLPSPHEPEWSTAYNSSEYHVVRDQPRGHLRVKLSKNPAVCPATRRGLDQLLGLLTREWHQVQDHPNISRAEFAIVANLINPHTNLPTVALVTPYYERHDFLAQCSSATMAEKTVWLAQVCTAVQHLHDHQIFHGNIHFRNIMIKDDGSACLTDVGLYDLVTRYIRDSHELPKTITCKTTKAVRLHCRGEQPREPNMHEDVFALASTIYTIFNGAEPWRERQAVTKILGYGHRVLEKPESMSDGLWALLHDLFSQDQRPVPTAHQIKRELLPSVPPGGLFPRMFRAIRRRSPDSD